MAKAKKAVQPKAILNIGSVIQAKAGGPKLNVLAVNGSTGVITAGWFDNRDRLFKGDFPAATINIIKS